MKNRQKKLPVGIEMFSDIRTEGFYYVDKTAFIKELLDSWGSVNLFTRPRRFGKSLTMSMLKAFFEIGTDATLFDGLDISKEKDLCDEFLGKFPVIFVSLKDIEGNSISDTTDMLESVITEEALRHQWLMDSPKLTSYDKAQLERLLTGNFGKSSYLTGSLRLLSSLLYKHFGKKTIILIDEYDVPLDKAYGRGYYEQAAQLIRSMFSQTLKTNSSLQFAIITGCLRISKESIFTGINNLLVNTIVDTEYDEYFGFTDEEVQRMVSYYGMEASYETIKEWYDGYQFGNSNIYCPWDVLSYVREHLKNATAPAKMYWINTSGNSIIRNLISRADSKMKAELEQLINGGSITKQVRLELTYKDLDKPKNGQPDTNRENLWSILFVTGYLTLAEPSVDARTFKLTIPNKEIHEIFTSQINEWFQDTVVQGDTARLQKFCETVKNGDAAALETMFSAYLADTISIRDTNTPKPMKENFYHGLLLGILCCEGAWIVRSNQESGIGYADILVEVPAEKIGCIFEMKYAENGNFDVACVRAMKQMEQNDYIAVLRQEGIQTIHMYGISCFKKMCKVLYKKGK